MIGHAPESWRSLYNPHSDSTLDLSTGTDSVFLFITVSAAAIVHIGSSYRSVRPFVQ